METRFCGRSIELMVAKSLVIDIKNSLLIGELRKFHQKPSFRIGDTFTKQHAKQEGERIFLGEYVNAGETHYNYIFDPPRKWAYKGSLREGENHLLTIYFVVEDKIVETLDSTSFKVIPIWKTKEERDEQSKSEKEKPMMLTPVLITTNPFPYGPPSTPPTLPGMLPPFHFYGNPPAIIPPQPFEFQKPPHFTASSSDNLIDFGVVPYLANHIYYPANPQGHPSMLLSSSTSLFGQITDPYRSLPLTSTTMVTQNPNTVDGFHEKPKAE